jgi:hypothetical protein
MYLIQIYTVLLIISEVRGVTYKSITTHVYNNMIEEQKCKPYNQNVTGGAFSELICAKECGIDCSCLVFYFSTWLRNRSKFTISTILNIYIYTYVFLIFQPF